MDSSRFLAHFQGGLSSDVYTEMGEMLDPIGMYVIRAYPEHTGMPEQYICLIHICHYEGRLLVSMDAGPKEEI